MLFRRILLALLALPAVSMVLSAQADRPNTFSIFGSAEYGADLASIQPASTPFRSGFFHSAGFYYRHDFARWYIRPGICYSQVLLFDSDHRTIKVHRLGLSCSAGYYVLNKAKWKLGFGGDIQGLYNLAGVSWAGTLDENTVTHFTADDMHAFGLELGLHTLLIWRFHPRWELQVNPYMEINVLPVFKPAANCLIRTGLTLGMGYAF